jgi:serine protease Do
MFVRLTTWVVLLGAAQILSAETIQLKDQASVTGRILAEKKDQVVVDLGFTVVTIPRDQIVRITAVEEPDAKDKGRKKPGAETKASPKPAPALAAPAGEDIYQTLRAGAPEKSVRDLVNQLGEAVVQVRTPAGMGSGFLISDEGYLITNFHVIENETQISVEVYHQRGGQLERWPYKQIAIIAINKFQDLALLKVTDKDAPRFVKVPLGDSDALAGGERVFAIGSPLGFERTVTEGIVSTKTRHYMGDLYLQTTTQINPGNSGGPLFNLRGEVVGVTNMKIMFGEGLGFAIPSDAVKFFLKHRDAYAYDNDNPSHPYRYLQPPSRIRKTVDDVPKRAD